MIALLRAKPFKDVTLGAILLGLLLALFVTTGILYARTVPHRTRAEAFLREFVRLTPGQSTFAEAQQVARQYGGIPWYVDSCGNMTCTLQKCVLAFQFDNMPLSYVPGAGYTRFFAEINVENGIMVGREVAYERSAFRYVVSDYRPATKGLGIWCMEAQSRSGRCTWHTTCAERVPRAVLD